MAGGAALAGDTAAKATADSDGTSVHFLDHTLDALLALALLGELGLVVLNVLARNLGQGGFLWTAEVAQFALATIAFLGGAGAYRRGLHGRVRVLIDLLPPCPRADAEVLGEWLVLLAAGLAGVASLPLVASSWGERTPILGLPAALTQLPLTLGMAVIALSALGRLRRHGVGRSLLLGMPLVVLAAILASALPGWAAAAGGNAVTDATVALLLLLALGGVPVGFALMLAAIVLLRTNTLPLLSLPQTMVDGTSNFVLLAVPFFIFAGLIMERGGISVRLVRLMDALVGHLRGGALQVTVGSMYLVSGLSGSKLADVAAVGGVMRPMLEAEGIGSGEAVAVLAAAAAMGETVPPSLAILVLGSITNLSVAALFLAGLAPAAVIALCLSLLIYLRTRRSGAARRRWAGGRAVAQAAAGAFLPMLMPAMLFAGILFGVATPTEVSAFAVLYGLVLALWVYRALGAAALLRTLADTAMLTGMVLFIIAAAAGFSWTLTVAGLPQLLVALLAALHAGPGLFMLGSIVLMVVVGSLLEGLPALNVLAPLLLPVAIGVGVSPVHYGIVLIIAMGIGGFLPPVGIGFYVCCAVMRTPIERAAGPMLPYLLVLLAGLLIVAFVPWVTLFLPRLAGFPG